MLPDPIFHRRSINLSLHLHEVEISVKRFSLEIKRFSILRKKLKFRSGHITRPEGFRCQV